MLAEVLGPVVGPQVLGMVEGLLHQKPASPVPTTPADAEMAARLHELYSTEKRLSKRVEEAKGRLDKARAKVLEGEEGSAKVEVEWKGGGGANKVPSARG